MTTLHTITRHYYAIRTTPYTSGVEFDTWPDAMAFAADLLRDKLAGKHGEYAAKHVQIDTRNTLKTDRPGTVDRTVDTVYLTENGLARANH